LWTRVPFTFCIWYIGFEDGTLKYQGGKIARHYKKIANSGLLIKISDQQIADKKYILVKTTLFPHSLVCGFMLR
jgi:hypothetical protein